MENGDNLKYSCPATQLRRSVRRGTPFGQADWTKATAAQLGLEDSAPARLATQNEHDEQGEFFLSKTVLLTTSLHTALWLRPDIYLGMSPLPPGEGDRTMSAT